MASKKQSRGVNIRQSILIVYVSVCVVAVVLTIVIAFAEAPSRATQPPTVTRTLSPLILTQQSEGSVKHPVLTPPLVQGLSVVEPDSEVFIPTATLVAVLPAPAAVSAEH